MFVSGENEKCYSVAFSPDGTKVISSSSDNTIRLWDVKTGKAIGESWQDYNDSIHSVAFSPDGTKVVTGDFYNSAVQLWDVEMGKAIGEPTFRPPF